MRRILVFAVFALFVFAPFANAQSDVISNVSVLGLKNVKQRAVLSEMAQKRGKVFSDEAIREDIKAISELNFFDDIQYDFNENTGQLTITVEERPYIEKIDFKGNKEFSRGKLRSESVLKQKGYFNQLDLDESIEKISTLYKNRGYTDVQIEAYPTTNPSTNKMTINVLITENNKVTIGGVDVEGTSFYKERKILRLIKKTRPKKVFNEDLYRADLTAVDTFYKENGFIDYQLTLSSISYNEDRTKIFITIVVSEGEQYKLGEITYWGNNVVPDKNMDKIIKLKKGKIYKQSGVNDTLQAIYETYSDKGYLYAQIGPEYKRDNGILDISFQIQEGIEVFVGNIYINGLESTKEKVIRREVRLKTGDPLAANLVRRSVERIYNLGFIDAVEPQLMPTRQRDVMDLDINVTEGRPGMVSAGIGYSSVDEFVGSLQLQHLNLFGLGQRLNLMAEFGFGASARRNYQIDWTEPYIFDRNVSLTLSGYQIERTRDYDIVTSAYREGRTGGAITLGPRFSDVVFLSVGYSYEHVRLFDYNFNTDNANEAYSYLKFLSDTGISRDNVSSIITSIAYDTRDVYFDPTRGQRQSLTTRLASDKLGGDTNFLKTSFRSSWYFPTFWRFVLGVNFTIARVVGYNNDTDENGTPLEAYQQVPLYERYYIGGADTVRGYDYQQIGYPGGATVMSIVNVEYKFPIIMDRRRTILQGVFFYDIGGSWKDMTTINTDIGTDEDNLRSGVGFGIRFATPMFPLRIDWGYGLDHKTGEKLQKFYFSIGNIF
ncbi:MAG: outer membrane protein assembly factor BamA [Elusimicrobiota bacterium]|jgi:outer membrane protein insertion porin family|nr:outer membrane protein assembly factor BamA [Elusimicrobiota bacterium]